MSFLTLNKRIPVTLAFIQSDSNEIMMRNMEIEFSIHSLAETNTPECMKQTHIDQTVTFQKCSFLIEEMIDNGFVYDTKSKNFAESILGFGFENNIIMLPAVNETVLIAALHSKFAALCSTRTHIDRVKLHDVTEKLTFDFMVDDEDDIDFLPGEQKEWLGSFPLWDTAWWHRPDITTYDNFAESQEKLDEWKNSGAASNINETCMGPFLEIEKTVVSMYNDPVDTPKAEKAEVINLDTIRTKDNKWTPQIVK